MQRTGPIDPVFSQQSPVVRPEVVANCDVCDKRPGTRLVMTWVCDDCSDLAGPCPRVTDRPAMRIWVRRSISLGSYRFVPGHALNDAREAAVDAIRVNDYEQAASEYELSAVLCRDLGKRAVLRG